MYDVIVVGQGLTGMLSAINAKKQNKKVALVAKGTGKILQSTGMMDLVPGSNKGFTEWMELFGFTSRSKISIKDAIKQFKQQMEKLDYPYDGEVDKVAQVVTASGHLKSTVLYPKTITPIPTTGRVVIVGFSEVVDFQPNFMKGNLQKSRPNLQISSMNISLSSDTQRTMTQLDAARELDREKSRSKILKKIKDELIAQNLTDVDLFIFPAALGINHWQETMDQFSHELKAAITEAPGLPPNATAIRLYEVLRKEAVKLGVRFFLDTEVSGFSKGSETVNELIIQMNNRSTKLTGHHIIICTGGILGGGLEMTTKGLEEKALQLPIDSAGTYVDLPKNVYPVGAAEGTNVVHYGITGGIYSIVSSYLALLQIEQSQMRGQQHA